MDLARILFTVLCFGSFIILVVITYRKGAAKGYDDVAQNIIDDDDNFVVSNETTEQQESSHHSIRENGANK